MKLPTKLSVMAIMAVLTLSCSTDAVEEEAINEIIASYIPETKVIEIEIMELINAHRIEQGLNTLNEMGDIKAQAYGHTQYMIDNNEMSHDNFITRKNNLEHTVGAVRVGENVAYGYGYAGSVVMAWINSPGHKAIMEGDYTNFDISAEQDADGRWYYTNIFIKK